MPLSGTPITTHEHRALKILFGIFTTNIIYSVSRLLSSSFCPLFHVKHFPHPPHIPKHPGSISTTTNTHLSAILIFCFPPSVFITLILVLRNSPSTECLMADACRQGSLELSKAEGLPLPLQAVPKQKLSTFPPALSPCPLATISNFCLLTSVFCPLFHVKQFSQKPFFTPAKLQSFR